MCDLHSCVNIKSERKRYLIRQVAKTQVWSLRSRHGYPPFTMGELNLQKHYEFPAKFTSVDYNELFICNVFKD